MFSVTTAVRRSSDPETRTRSSPATTAGSLATRQSPPSNFRGPRVTRSGPERKRTVGRVVSALLTNGGLVQMAVPGRRPERDVSALLHWLKAGRCSTPSLDDETSQHLTETRYWAVPSAPQTE